MTEFLASAAALLIYGTLHSLLASLRAKRWAARRFGRAGVRYYRLAFVVIGGLTFLPLLWLLYAAPGPILYALGSPWRWLLHALQGLCLLALVFSVGQTGGLRFLGLDVLLPSAPVEPAEADPTIGPHHLVTGGLYRQVRHPIYTFTLLLLFLMPVVNAAWLGLSVGSLIYILAAIPFEERKLVVEFGQAYRDYQARVPALIPGLKPRR